MSTLASAIWRYGDFVHPHKNVYQPQNLGTYSSNEIYQFYARSLAHTKTHFALLVNVYPP